jgi:hypothetical protein
MGVRGEIFSTRIILPNRTYFFNVKENRMGDVYLNIVESKNRGTGGFDRQSVILFADDLQEFLKGFDESLRVLEKAVREKRRSGSGGEGAKREDRRDEKSADFPPHRRGEKAGHGERTGRAERTERGGKDKYGFSGEKSGRTDKGRKSEHNYERGAKRNNGERGYDRRSKGNKSDYGSDHGPKGGKRVVVRKSER